jgi:hypothetical protein
VLFAVAGAAAIAFAAGGIALGRQRFGRRLPVSLALGIAGGLTGAYAAGRVAAFVLAYTPR